MKAYILHIIVDGEDQVRGTYESIDQAESAYRQIIAEMNSFELDQGCGIRNLPYSIEESKPKAPLEKDIIQVWEALLQKDKRIILFSGHWVYKEDADKLKPYEWPSWPLEDKTKATSFYSTISEQDAIAQAEALRLKWQEQGL